MGHLGSHTPLYLCVYVPEFPTQARLRFQRKLTATPIAVLEGDPPLEQVCSLNRAAQASGIEHGMTRAELDSFPELTMMRRSRAEERTTQNALLGMSDTFTHRVQIHRDEHADKAAFIFVLDMTGTTRLFGSASQITRRIRQTLHTLGITARLACSANYLTAVCAAAFAVKAPIFIEQHHEREALSSFPLIVLPLTEDQRSTFETWGIRTLGELAALPEVDLVTRLGQAGKRLRLLARGEHPHLMVPEEPAFTLEEHVAFDTPIDMFDSLLFVLGPMLDQLLLRANAHALALALVTMQLALDGGGEHVRTIKPALPLADRDVLLKLLHLDLQAHPLSAGIMTVQVHAEPAKRSKVQTGLFSAQLPEPTRLDVTLARIAALVGENRVGRARLLDAHRPEAFVMERFTVPTATPRQQTASSTTALRRMRPPVPLNMRLHETRPDSFFHLGKRFVVQQAHGPWRRSGDWWSEQVWSQEQWDVQATANDGETLLCVLVQDLLAKRWQLEALYD